MAEDKDRPEEKLRSEIFQHLHDWIKGGMGEEDENTAQIDAMIARAILKAREEVFWWQPIETAPKDGTWVIVFCPDYKEERVRPASYQSDVGLGEDIWDFAADCYELASSDSAPTLWMQLPSPPAIRQHSQKGER